jgi:hypothetical protein
MSNQPSDRVRVNPSFSETPFETLTPRNPCPDGVITLPRITETLRGSNSESLANFCNDPRSTRNLYLSKKEANAGKEGFLMRMDAGSGTVEQY